MDKLFIDLAKFIYHKFKDQLHKLVEDETASQSSSHTRQSDLSYMNRLAHTGVRNNAKLRSESAPPAKRSTCC